MSELSCVKTVKCTMSEALAWTEDVSSPQSCWLKLEMAADAVIE